MTLDSKPSGSSHTWCSRFGKRRTFDSKEGQYLQQSIAMSITWHGEKVTFQKQSRRDPQFQTVCQLVPLRALHDATYSPWAPRSLLYMVVQVEVIKDNLLGFGGSASQVTWQLIFWLKEDKAHFKLIQSQLHTLTEQLSLRISKGFSMIISSHFLERQVVLPQPLYRQSRSNQRAWATSPKADQEQNRTWELRIQVLFYTLHS